MDQFLKASRLVKRRTVAKELADQGRVLINGRTAKAGTTVSVGDKLTLLFGQKEVTVEVLDLKENPKKEEADSLYRMIEEKKRESDEG